MSGKILSFVAAMFGGAPDPIAVASPAKARGPSDADCREFLNLFRVDGLDTRSIGAMTGFREADVYNGLHRARLALAAGRE